MLSKTFKHGRIKPKPVKTFGVKKPFKGTNKNRKGSLKPTNSKKRNPLVLEDYYRHCVKIANMSGCDCHHFIPKSKLKQDIFLTMIPYDEHREIHAGANNITPASWALEKGFNVLIEESMTYFHEWCLDNDMPSEYFELIEELKSNPLMCHDIARDFVRENRSL